jgi:hypothetical protein
MRLERLAAKKPRQIADKAHSVAHQQPLQRWQALHRGEAKIAGELHRR